VRGALGEPAVRGGPVGVFEVEGDPRVHAPLAEVAVQRGRPVPEVVQQGAEVAEVVAEPVGRHRRVLPALVGVRAARRVRGRAQTRLTDLPQPLLLTGFVQEGHARVVLGAVDVLQEAFGAFVGLLASVAAEPHHQPPRPLRHLLQHAGLGDVFDAGQVDERVVDPFEGEGLVLGHPGDGVSGGGDAVEAEDDQGLVRRDGEQLDLRLQHGDQRRLAADQGAGEVEPLLRQERVQVVARDPPRDVGVAGTDQREVLLGQVPQCVVDLGAAATLGEDPVVLLLARGPDPHPGAVVGQHLHAEDGVDHLPVRLGGRAAGVVADHPADRAGVVRRRFGTDHQLMRRELLVQVVQARPGLHHRDPPAGVHRHQAMAVLGPVDHHARVAALPGQARAAPTGEHRDVVLTAHGDGLDGRVDSPWDHHTDRHLPVVGRVMGVRRTGPGVETHLAVDPR
jgi:hypothetical protein